MNGNTATLAKRLATLQVGFSLEERFGPQSAESIKLTVTVILSAHAHPSKTTLIRITTDNDK